MHYNSHLHIRIVVPLFLGVSILSLGVHSIQAMVGEKNSTVNMSSCDDAVSCGREKRMLLPNKNPIVVERLKRRGCRIVHELKEKLSIACPKNIDVAGARVESVFSILDETTTKRIGADVAWSQGLSGATIRVAVLDTGIAPHRELNSRIVKEVNFTDDTLEDRAGHGSHVAGIIAAPGIAEPNPFPDGGFELSGITADGVAPGVQLLIGKVCRNNGTCYEGDILAGMEWAVKEKADVANMSFGAGQLGGDHCENFNTLAATANWMVDNGVVVVAASGNDGGGVYAPACGSKVIAVGALKLLADEKTSWSSWGTALDLMAPGSQVYSSFSCYISSPSCPFSPYTRLSGTSMAAPHVTGVVALLLGKYPELTPAQVYTILTQSARDIGNTGFDTYTGYGIVNAGAMVNKALELYPELGCVDEDSDGFTTCGGDCNDADYVQHPGAHESCNLLDDDCDAVVDDACTANDFCGDGICTDAQESSVTCPMDCTIEKETTKGNGKPEKEIIVCGDGLCTHPENHKKCAMDCAAQGKSQHNSATEGSSTSGVIGESSNVQSSGNQSNASNNGNSAGAGNAGTGNSGGSGNGNSGGNSGGDNGGGNGRGNSGE